MLESIVMTEHIYWPEHAAVEPMVMNEYINWHVHAGVDSYD